MSKAVKGVVNTVTGGVFGGSGSSGPGMLGTGRFKGSKLGVDRKPFERELAGQGTQEEVRKRQEQQSQRLEERATGQRPSLAEAQMRATTDRNLAQQLAAAQSRRGGSASVREREMARAQSRAGRQVAQDSATARLQEQQQNEQLLAQQLQNQRAQDVNLAESDRASAQKLQELLMQEHLGVQGLNLSGFQSAAQQRSGLIQQAGSGLSSIAMMSDKDKKKKIKKENYKSMSDAEKKAKQKKESKNSKDKKEPSKFVKGLKAFSDGMSESEPKVAQTSSAGENALERAMSRISDENKKKGITKLDIPEAPKPPEKKESKGGGMDASSLAKMAPMLKKAAAALSDSDKKEKMSKEDMNPKSFLDALQAYSYEYKDSAKKDSLGGEGRYLSVMAQDLEKAGPVGKSMVIDTPDGKIVDYGKGFGAILAAQAHLNERLKELESKKKKS